MAITCHLQDCNTNAVNCSDGLCMWPARLQLVSEFLRCSQFSVYGSEVLFLNVILKLSTVFSSLSIVLTFFYFELYIWRLGSLIKLIYFSRHAELSTKDKRKISTKRRLGMFNGGRRSYPILGGRLHFVKFETEKLNECLDFISSKQLHRGGMQTLLWTVNNWNPVSSSLFLSPRRSFSFL